MMPHIFFIFLLLLASIIRTPVSVFFIILKNVLPSLKKRIAFERKNFLEEECRSFKKDGVIADYCFEVSSEGELEQVRPLLEYFLQHKKRIELIFSSPSVESKCIKMARQFPEQMRVLRLPLATHSFLFQSVGFWMTAPKIFFCRYDFFPELLILKFVNKKFILLSASGKKPSWFKREVYKFFDVFVAVNRIENIFFKSLFPHNEKIFDFDFRIPRIFERIQRAQKTLAEVSELRTYLEFLSLKPPFEKLIMGSAWPSDFIIFETDNENWNKKLRSGHVHLLVVPHDLKPQSIDDLKTQLTQTFPEIPIQEISKNINQFDPLTPGIVLLNLSGQLCELYTQFNLAYVGGGFARSIHSVLEPFLGGAIVFCGPKVHRSSEYDFVKDIAPFEIHLLNNQDSFYNLFNEQKEIIPNKSTRSDLQQLASIKMMDIIKEIEAC